eukprot:g5480.t1
MSDVEVPGALFHGIKIGAVDFLKRPLDEAKVRSMWQHTLHKRLANASATLDEGPSNLQRKPGELDPLTDATHFKDKGFRAAAMIPGRNSAPSEGSSNEPKAMVYSPLLDSAVKSQTQTPLDPATSHEVTSKPTSGGQDPSSSSSVLPPRLISPRSQDGSPRQETEKRNRTNSTTDQSRRRIRPNLLNREPVPVVPNASLGVSTPMSVPPLLGIPPGCVPPVDSSGMAIGMPFLNRHPFVPATTSTNSFGFTTPYLFGTNVHNEMPTSGGQTMQSIPDVTAFAPFPLFPMRPTGLTGMVPTNLASPPRPSSTMMRVGSTPNTFMSRDMVQGTNLMLPTQEGESSNVPSTNQEAELPLKKSPSLINF